MDLELGCSYDVPQFTTSEGDPAGTIFPYNVGNVAAGATRVVGLDFHHPGGHGPSQRRFGLPYCGSQLYPCRA
jgi:hypothetical protein